MVVISYMADGDGVCRRDTHNAQCYYEGLYLYKYTRTTQCVVRATMYFRKEKAKLDCSPFCY